MSFQINKIKTFNHDDKYNFLPDNQTIGTAQYYKKKYGDKFSDYDYRILEIKSRDGYTEQDLNDAIVERKHNTVLVVYEYNEIVNSPMDAHYKLMHDIKTHYKNLNINNKK